MKTIVWPNMNSPFKAIEINQSCQLEISFNCKLEVVWSITEKIQPFMTEVSLVINEKKCEIKIVELGDRCLMKTSVIKY
jgi:hypothetical protein